MGPVVFVPNSFFAAVAKHVSADGFVGTESAKLQPTTPWRNFIGVLELSD
jgi:hypothetical protein